MLALNKGTWTFRQKFMFNTINNNTVKIFLLGSGLLAERLGYTLAISQRTQTMFDYDSVINTTQRVLCGVDNGVPRNFHTIVMSFD